MSSRLAQAIAFTWIASLAALFPSQALATDGTWEKLLPGGLAQHAAVFDPVGDRMVVFGGHDGQNIATSDTWVLPIGPGGSWSHLRVTGTVPTPRTGHIAIYDPVRQRMIVFGGTDNDVWALSLSGTPAWARVVVTGTPPPILARSVAAYDPVRDRLIVFGGSDGMENNHNETWALTLAGTPTWTLLTPAGDPPSTRNGAAGVYDPVRDRLVVFGGQHDSVAVSTMVTYLDDVWELSLSGNPAWTELAPSGTAPSRRCDAAAIYDPDGDRMVLQGGRGTNGLSDIYASDTWALSLAGVGSWSPLPAAAARARHSIIYDSARHRAVVFGGTLVPCHTCGNSYYHEVDALDLTGVPAWTEITPLQPPWSAISGHQMVYDSARNRVLILGGLEFQLSPVAGAYGMNPDIWVLSLDGGGWSKLEPDGVGPLPLWFASAVYDAVRDRVIVFGGADTIATRSDAWQLSLLGTPVWSLLSTSGPAPKPRSAHAAVIDAARDRMIVFGGADGQTTLNDTWALSLGSPPKWSEVVPFDTLPPPQAGTAAILDSIGGRLVIFGGVSGGVGVSGRVWALSLESNPVWTRLAPAGPPAGLGTIPSAVRDDRRDRMVLFGGRRQDAYEEVETNSTAALTLTPSPVWSPLSPPQPWPVGREEHGAIYDPIGDRMIVYGGYNIFQLNDDAYDFPDVWALAFSDNIVATAASLVSARAIPGGVRLTWQAADAAGVAFTIERRLESNSWTALAARTTDASDIVTYDDTTLEPGAHASYRLAWNASDGRHTTAVTEWSMPLAAAPGLGAPYPNPATTAFTVRFALATPAPARLELFDVAGRRVRSIAVSAAPGVASVARFDALSGLPPGIYQVRLSQAGRAFVRRLALTH